MNVHHSRDQFQAINADTERNVLTSEDESAKRLPGALSASSLDE